MYVEIIAVMSKNLVDKLFRRIVIAIAQISVIVIYQMCISLTYPCNLCVFVRNIYLRVGILTTLKCKLGVIVHKPK